MEESVNILLLEDNPNDAELVYNRVLKSDIKFQWSHVSDYDVFIEALTSFKPDLILSDYNLIGFTGMDALEVALQKCPLVPFIIVTGTLDEETAAETIKKGAWDYVVKERLTRLSTAIKSALQLKEEKENADRIRNSNIILKTKNDDITSSIVYASYIQRAMLPSTKILKNIIHDSFVLYKPKDIVSGDFYWFKQSENFLYIVAADCTGHGIPGAFLSILTLVCLNQIMESKRGFKTPQPYEILTELRKHIIKSLNQNDQQVESHEGLDIAFCIIDIKNNILQYAGANNPLFLIRKKWVGNNSELIQIKSDKMPVGMHLRDRQDFVNHEIKIQDGDIFYIFTDGYISQFDKKGKKLFSKKRFQEILLKNQDKPMEIQKQILERTLHDWQGKYEQTDDILIIGMRINIH